MSGWRVAPGVLMDSPVPKSNNATEAESGEGKSGKKQDGCAPSIARKALENAGKAALQVFSQTPKYKFKANEGIFY